ncbi:MAG: helix-turn-helix domain-containing protein [Gemmataceae bacterium]|nr:helix-turn-helix domain-containing protein [Gemmataceae bacterium]
MSTTPQTNLGELPFPPDPIKPTEAAKLLGKHLATIYRWIDDGTLPHWVEGKRQRVVSRRDVLAMRRRGQAKRPRADKPAKTSQWEEEEQERRTRETLERWGSAKYLR